MWKGKKTYAVAIIGTIGAVANLVIKIINNEPITADDIYAILGFLGLGTVRAGIKNG